MTVHINSTAPVSLEKRASGESAWQHVCNSPCDAPASATDEYQIVGENLNESKPFILDASQGDKVTLDVTPGFHKKAETGKWILVGGGALVVGGVIMLVGGSRSNNVPGDSGVVSTNTNDDWIFAGTAVIVAGVIAGVTGGSFIVDNAHTKVDGAVGAVPDRKTDVKFQVQVTADRQPTWHEDRGPQMAASRFVPILTSGWRASSRIPARSRRRGRVAVREYGSLALLAFAWSRLAKCRPHFLLRSEGRSNATTLADGEFVA